MSTEQQSREVLAAAKLWLTSPAVLVPGAAPVGDMPYLSAALYALVTVHTERVASLATDPSWRLYVNPSWLADSGRTIPEVGRELAHHVWHLLAEHADRAADVGVVGSTSRAWRVAADATIHDVIGWLTAAEVRSASSRGWVAGGRAAPTCAAVGATAGACSVALGDEHRVVGAALLGLPPGRSAEEYFAMLSGLPTDEGEGPDRDPSWVPRDAGAAGTQVGADPSCGSGCDGLPRDHELAEVDIEGGLTRTEADAVRKAVAIEYREATRGRGDAPREWARWVSQVLEPVVDWRNVLHAAVRRGLGWANGHADYTYTRISRRQSVSGQVILPALRRPVPRVAVVVDTSGSVDDGLLAQALGEVDGVLAGLGVPDAQVTVLAVDAAVHTVTTVSRASAVPLAGGGGTDMPMGIVAAQALRPRVDVIVVLTDGCTPWPARPAEVPVIAVIIGRRADDLPPTPEWIQRVECVP